MRSSISSTTAQSAQGDVAHGIIGGLMPLLRLIVALAVALALPLVARLATNTQSFAFQQNAAVIAFAVGLVLAAVVYAVSLIGTFRRMGVWSEAERGAQATAALWMLALTALIVALPVIVAAVVPQHPAP
jgi:hypothetical protein